MTVKDLILELQKYPENLDVFINEEMVTPINIRETQIGGVNVLALCDYDDLEVEY